MMRKVLLLVMLAIGYAAGAQETIQTFEAQMGVRKNKSKEWKWRKSMSCSVVFTLNHNVIKTNDKANSSYTTYETIFANDDKGIWKAHDQNGKNCIITIEYGNPKNIIKIQYSYTCYKYFFYI